MENLYEGLKIINTVNTMLSKYTGIDKASNILLTSLTAGKGYGFNRAFLFLLNLSSNKFEGFKAIGPASREEAHRIWQEVGSYSFKEILKKNLDYKLENDFLNDALKKLETPVNDSKILDDICTEHKTIHYLKEYGNVNSYSLISEIISSSEYVLLPLPGQERVIGMVLADNPYGIQAISNLDIALLQNFVFSVGQVIENINLMRNIDDLKENEKKAEKGKESVLSTIFHEIKNPVAAIGGYLNYIIKNHIVDSDVKSKLLKVNEQVLSLEKLISEISSAHKPINLNKDKNNINELINEVLHLYSYKLKEENIDINLSLETDIEDFYFDYEKIKQVLTNLLLNAVQSFRGEEGCVEIVSEKLSKHILIRIKDNGIGIPEKDLERIFEMFFSTKKEGSGVGLAVSKKIIEAHDGKIEVKSEYKKYTEFRVYLPI